MFKYSPVLLIGHTCFYTAKIFQICLGAKTILSNVEVQDDVDIPPGFLYHTVPILIDGTRKHVTVAFHVTDDMKFSADIDRAENLQFGGRLLEKLFSISPQIYNKSSVFPQNSTASLWNARIFTAHTSMSASFLATVRMISSLVSKVNKCKYFQKDLFFHLLGKF